jgi:hypothetical protein
MARSVVNLTNSDVPETVASELPTGTPIGPDVEVDHHSDLDPSGNKRIAPNSDVVDSDMVRVVRHTSMTRVFGPATTHWSQRRAARRLAGSTWSKSVADYERTRTALRTASTKAP